jgi:hypothetical protein
MPYLPGFMATLATGGAAPPGFAGAPTRRILDVNLTLQEQTNWCWAAVTQALLRFVHHREVSQEAIASRHMQLTDKLYTCAGSHRREVLDEVSCGDGACDAGCNNAHFLRIIMTEQGCFDDFVSSEAPPRFRDIQLEINARRPLPCRVQWDPKDGEDQGGHFIIVSGWEVGPDEEPRVHVLDPLWNEGTKAVVRRTMAYDDFAKAYVGTAGNGSINFSYRVR